MKYNTFNEILEEIESNFKIMRAYIGGKKLDSLRVAIEGEKPRIVNEGQVNYDQIILSVIGVDYFIDSLDANEYDTKELRKDFYNLINKCLMIRNASNN